MRKSSVGLMLDLDELEWQMPLEQVDYRSRHAVARIGNYLEWFQLLPVTEISEQVLDVFSAEVGFYDAALRPRCAKGVFFRNAPDILQPAVAAQGFGAFAHELKPVVIDRVVARGNHDAAVELEMKRGEIYLFGPAQAQVEYFDTAIGQSAGERIE